jgi:hypothetical protein
MFKRLLLPFLAAYTGLLSVSVGVCAYYIRVESKQNATVDFDRIRAHRIDLVEPDGTLRLILSNRADYPGSFFHGKEISRPDRRDSAGLLMIDDEGTEDGGLIFSGRMINGMPVTSGHLSFDQYDQDQTLSLSRTEENGTTESDLVLSDQPHWPLTPQAIDEFTRVKMMADGPAKRAAWTTLMQKYPAGHARAILRREENGSVGLTLNDGSGIARLRLYVEAGGNAAIDFLDSVGHTVRSLSADNR